MISLVHELLIQSHHSGQITLLPALPKEWMAGGRVIGFRARGGISLSFHWRNGNIQRVSMEVGTDHPYLYGFEESNPGIFHSSFHQDASHNRNCTMRIFSPNELVMERAISSSSGSTCASWSVDKINAIEESGNPHLLTLMSFPCSICLCTSTNVGCC